ncbi:hypothetical protein GB882_03105, partial [Georgenia ruanii]|nr:hypothetical protein [Georgenia ruanii]
VRSFVRRGSVAAATALTLLFVAGSAAGASSDDVPQPTADAVTRVAGTDRIGTAIAASQAQQPAPVAPGTGTVILSRSDDFADTLTAVPLADELDALILTTPSGADLDPRVAAEVQRLAPAHVVVVGGAGAVSTAAEASLKAVVPGQGAVVRISGVDRYDTAAQLARWTITSRGQSAPTEPRDMHTMWPIDEANERRNTPVFLATGLDYPDALAAGAAAAQTNGVVLLTRGDQFDDHTGFGGPKQRSYTLNFMVDEEGGRITGPVHTVGGPAMRATSGNYTSLVGADRYETAALVARYAGWFPAADTHTVAIASGEDYADAVVAAGFIANQDGPLLLTRAASLSAVTANYLASVSSAETATQVHLFGGTGAVSGDVATAIRRALR